MSGDTSHTVTRVAYRTCPLCEATCGLEISLDAADQVVRIRGDKDDVFSRGFICPKGSTLKQIHEDPDRLRQPMAKIDGVHVPVSWDEAWALVADGFARIINERGRSALGAYLGNPGAHSLALMMFTRVMLQSMGSRNIFSASSVDQMPKHVAGGFMFGTPQSIPVPDIDRTDYLFMLGANPHASNGSLCTAPDFPGRMEAIRARGGKIVVVDPRRTKTAQASDEWVAIRPGTDVLFLAAFLNVLFTDDLVSLGDLDGMVDGVDEIREAVAHCAPESVSDATGVSAADIRRYAHEFAAAPSAVMYGRMGVNTVEFGTVCAWLIDAINTVTGNLDRPGGAMFTTPAVGGATTRGKPRVGAGFRTGRGRTRVRQAAEVLGEYPVATLGEEILTPGDGQIRAMITVGGNPIVSTPNNGQLDAAFESLDFMVSVDIYLNETTRHADVILPSPSQLQKDHYDVSLYTYAVRNIANYSPAVLPRDPGAPDEWEIMAKLAGILSTLDATVDVTTVDDIAVAGLVKNAVKDESSPAHGKTEDEVMVALAVSGRRGPARMLDVMLQAGPFGAGFGSRPDGVSLDMLLDNPHGVDLGALVPRMPDMLRTASGRIELAPVAFLDDLQRAVAMRTSIARDQMLLIGRRELKSNNSWMHNLNVLTKGALACTLMMHPDDARSRGLVDGDLARVSSDAGEVTVSVEVTEDIRRGVVSLPHGWGHDVPGTTLTVAARKPGVNSNRLTDHRVTDALSGNAILNAISVTVSAVA